VKWRDGLDAAQILNGWRSLSDTQELSQELGNIVLAHIPVHTGPDGAAPIRELKV